MRKPALRVYGTFFGVPEAARPHLLGRHGFDIETLRDGKLELEYEGNWCEVDDFLDALRPFLHPDLEGKLDVIDNHDWTLTRHVAVGGTLSSATRSCDDALEKYHQE